MDASTDRRRVRLLVTDLDNTLWDWFDIWFHSFSALLDRLVDLSGVSRETLEREIREIHQARSTTEYSYLLNELPSLMALVDHPALPADKFDAAAHAQNRERLTRTRLYPDVMETLQTIRKAQVPIVAYSESLAFWTEWRIRKTGLDGVLTALYTSPDHDFPSGVHPREIRTRPDHEYGLLKTTHEHVGRGLLKPNAALLNSIMDRFDTRPEETVYVGDSLMKDVAMAQQVGAIDVHAAYGLAQDRSGYELLRRVSHWTQSDIERERELGKSRHIKPSYTLRASFSELLQEFDFKRGEE
ncbi:HAD family hydrolase [Pseudonocardia sp. ICBG1034]|uniref:HAD family hydrolase n=1 Tax=Pseudonocardia sp. ICBG1034 TaxID=2844381 RepID=UPI001CCDEC56|nr:HAD family hydrolase [Pseudonocardia sp. ICBG1034]